MWCGESFKSLADMTVHMTETQHYTKVKNFRIFHTIFHTKSAGQCNFILAGNLTGAAVLVESAASKPREW